MSSLRWIILLSLGLNAGCAAPAPETPPAASTTPALSTVAAAFRDRLTNTENGLEVRRWIVPDLPNRLFSALSNHVDGYAIDDDLSQRLKRNGFRFLRVPADSIESLLADLGGASYDAHEWHGQVHEWRSLLDRPIDDRGRAIAIDGIVNRYERGEFRLMLRCWTVQMESGPFVHLELLPRRRLPQTNNLRRLLGESTSAELGYGSMAIDTQLDSAYAYILLGESPQIDWPGLDSSQPAGDASNNPTNSWRRSRPRGLDGAGPDAMPPQTLGELMLAPDRATSSRAVLVFVPKIAAALFLPEQMAATPTRSGQPNKGSGG